MTTIIITSDRDSLSRHFGDDLLVSVCAGQTLECELNEDGHAEVLYRGVLKFWLDKSLFTVKEELDPREQKYPTVYRQGGCGSRWIATYQFLDLGDAQRYIDQFDDERIVRWVKYRPEKVSFTDGKGWRESGLPSSKALRIHIG